jgi:MFS family permease
MLKLTPKGRSRSMNRTAKFSRIFFGWWTVLAGGIIAFLGVGFAGYGFSVLFKPIAADLMLNRAMTSAANSVQNLGNGVAGPLGGWASDKYGPKWVIILGIICMVASCVLMYFVNSLWALLIIWGLLMGIGFSFGFSIIIDKAIVNWFVKKSGVALNIKFGIQSLSALFLLPVVAWLIDSQGWRLTCVIMAIVIAVVSFPLAWFFIKANKPEHYGFLPDGQAESKMAVSSQTSNNEVVPAIKSDVQEFTFRQTAKTLGFWILIAVVAISGLATPIMGVHSVPFLTDMGIDPDKAAGMMSIWITCSIPARIFAGFMVDRMKIDSMRWVIVVGYLLQALSVTIYLTTRNPVTIYVWFVLYGIGQGISSGAFIPVIASYFGRKYFGSIMGTMLLLNLPITLAAPVYVGWVYDTTRSYTSVFFLLAGLLALSGVVAAFILPPKSFLRVGQAYPNSSL